MNAIQKISDSRINALIESFLQTLNQKQVAAPAIFDWVQQFSGIPIDIFGSVYENFRSQRPEERKADGVYYTPQYIVDYIVENTVGKLIKGKTPQEVAKIKIVDPACGCGIFLLRAYQYLLDWHKDYYAYNKPWSKESKNNSLTFSGELAISEKKKILVNNIFGVDIDPIAVELAKFSLLLKCMEGETTASIENTQRLFHEKVLPNIDSNIKCGNSLIGNDFYQQSNFQFSEQEQIKINAFDWKYEFPQVFKRGSKFNVVIGNPPWEVVIGKEHKQNIKYLTLLNDYYKRHYTMIQGETNLYRLFAERIINTLLVSDGRWGYIMPSSILNDRSASNLRKLFLTAFQYIEVNHFPEKAKVFKQITQDVCIYCFSNAKSQIRLRTGLVGVAGYQKKFVTLPKKLIQKLDKIPFCQSKQEANLLLKFSDYETFGEKDVIKFLEGEIHLTKYKAAILPHSTGKNVFPLIRGDALQRYTLQPPGKDSFLDEKVAKSISDAPKLMDYDKTRLVYQQIVNIQKDRRLNFYLLDREVYVANTCGYALVVDSTFDIRFCLGLLNSKLLNWRYKQTSSNNHILTNELQKLPFPIIDLSQKTDKAKHDELVLLVDTMLDLKKREKGAMMRSKTIIERQTASTDAAINGLVYELYGLTKYEIAIVERR